MTQAVQQAIGRRQEGIIQAEMRVEWFIDDVLSRVDLNLRQNMEIVTEYVRSKVVRNISRPVTKTKSKRTGRTVVSNRSKPGEFPKADTTQLKKSIFKWVKTVDKGVVDGYVGTPLDYGLILETSKRLNRSFLARTLREERARIVRMLGSPIR